MNWPLRTLALAALCCLPANAQEASSSSYASPSLAALHVRSVCIMPVEAKLYRLGMKGPESMLKESDDWTTNLQAVVETHFKAAEMTVLSASDALNSTASSEELQQAILDVQQKYHAAASQVQRKPKELRSEHFTLGDSVSLLPCSAKSDVLVFAEGQGRILSNGKETMTALVGGPTTYGFFAITLVDAKTGDVLAYIRMMDTISFQASPEVAFGEALDGQLHKLHIDPTAASHKH